MSTLFRDVQESGCIIKGNDGTNAQYRQKIHMVQVPTWGVTIGRKQVTTCNDKQPARFLLAINNLFNYSSQSVNNCSK